MKITFDTIKVGMVFMYVGTLSEYRGVHAEVKKKRFGVEMLEIHFETGSRMTCDANFIRRNFVPVLEMAKKKAQKTNEYKPQSKIDISPLIDLALMTGDYKWCAQLQEGVIYGKRFSVFNDG